MKKISIAIILIMILMTTTVFAAELTDVSNTSNQTEGIIPTVTPTGELIELQGKAKEEVQDYISLYGSETYGWTAYILNKVRLFSIPLCFVGIAVGAIFQYVIGIRKVDVRDRGFQLIIGFVTTLIICQILPLIFTIVVKGWRG